MEIPEKLIKFKLHILAAVLVCAVVSSLILVAPRFLTILAYFWPLLLSTALFLIAVLVFGKTTSSSPANERDKAGEGLLDFVAGEPDHLNHHHHHHHHHHQPVEDFKVEEEGSAESREKEHRVESSNSKSEQ